MSKNNTHLRASAKKPNADRLELSQEEARAEWRTLSQKRIRLWNAGQELSPDEDLRIRQLIATFNRYNK